MRVLIPGFFSFLLLWISTIQLHGQYQIDLNVLKQGKIIPAALINTAANESSPILINDQIYFISDREGDDFDIFKSDYKQGMHGDVTRLGKKYNSSQHEGSICECNGNFYFSRSVKKMVNGVKTDGLQLMSIQKAIGKIIPIKTSKNLMHITCSGNAMYATEIGPNKTTNIVKIDNKGNTLTDVDLSLLNSNSNDAFPNLIHDSIMIFASKRPGGYGGLDLYVSVLNNNVWAKPILLPPPFNTPFDDFALTLFDNGKSGLLSSNRPGGKGGDDVYFWSTERIFVNYEAQIPFANFELTLIDKLTSEPVVGSYVKLYKVKDDKSLSILKNIKIDNFEATDTIASKTIAYYVDPTPILLLSNDNGQVKTSLPVNQDFVVEILSSSHDRLFYLLTSEQWTRIEDLALPLSPIDYSIQTSNDETLTLADNIINKWEVRGVLINGSSISFSKDAQRMLSAIIEELKDSYDARIEIIAYSDARGNEVQNLKKTQDLATALKKWLSFKGVSNLNMEALGAGDTKILNHCQKGVSCSTSEHEINNRIEIIVFSKK